MILTQQQLHDALVERHGTEIQKKLDGATVGIAGLGGLGSNLAVFLARLGIGHMILVDFDVVDITNLNRQHYTMKDLGVPKTLALVEQLEAINPYLNYETYTERVIPANVKRLFSECDVIVEAFDKPDQKAMLIENVLTQLPDKPLVSGSGMAGYGSANLIRTEKRFGHLYLCGDGKSDVADGLGLMAPRVAVCSAHVLSMPLRFLGNSQKTVWLEVQLRTIAMDCWANIEHQLKYKQNIPDQALLLQELKRCADEITSTDLSLQTIRDLIEHHEEEPI